MQRTLAILKARNVTGVTDGEPEVLEKWKAAGGEHIIPALAFDPESGKPSVEELRQLVKSKRVMAFAEISSQYEGIAVSDADGTLFRAGGGTRCTRGNSHGTRTAGAPYVFAPSYRMKLPSLLMLEDVLVKHPKMRLWAMHARCRV